MKLAEILRDSDKSKMFQLRGQVSRAFRPVPPALPLEATDPCSICEDLDISAERRVSIPVLGTAGRSEMLVRYASPLHIEAEIRAPARAHLSTLQRGGMRELDFATELERTRRKWGFA